MATKPMKQSNAIPQRGEIETKYTWNLGDLYPDDTAWEADYKAAQEVVKKASEFKGKLADSPAILYECLEARSNLDLKCHCLYQYAKLNQDLDNRVSKYQAMTERAAMLNTQAAAAFSFVEPELMQVADDKLLEMSAQFPKTDIFDFFIKELVRSREHIRSEEVEELLAQSLMMARGPETIFSLLDDADLKYPSMKDEDGHEVQLTKQRFQKFMESAERRVRKEAHEKFNSVYAEHINSIGASLASSVNKDIFYSRARKYESCLHHGLDAFNIPVSVYHSLIDTTESNLEGLHRWIGLRKKVLGLDMIYPYDIYNPLFPEQNLDISYSDAIKEILTALAPLGKTYVSMIKKAFESRWVDVYETEGKSGGAYSWGNYAAHPFIMMNYNNTFANMLTLAHEMGHAMHSYNSNQAQPYAKAQYSIFVAEVASTLNEGLLFHHLVNKVPDEKQKLFLLNKQIDKTLTVYFHQIFFAHFELMIHELVEKGEALSPDKACRMWEELNIKYYGPEITMDEYSKYKWARIPHYYRMYYVYQYATSYAASQAILAKFLAGEEGIIEKYLELLSSGGNDYPVNQLKKCGVDMTTSAPFEATIKLFGEQVDEVA